jgi:hypothetical protein
MSELELRLHHDLLRLRWQGKGPWIERWVNGSLEDARDALRSAITQILRDQSWWVRWMNRPSMLVVLEPDAQADAIKSIWMQALERQPVKSSWVMLPEAFEQYFAQSHDQKPERLRHD